MLGLSSPTHTEIKRLCGTQLPHIVSHNVGPSSSTSFPRISGPGSPDNKTYQVQLADLDDHKLFFSDLQAGVNPQGALASHTSTPYFLIKGTLCLPLLNTLATYVKGRTPLEPLRHTSIARKKEVYLEL